jgi:hypothetical protein
MLYSVFRSCFNVTSFLGHLEPHAHFLNIFQFTIHEQGKNGGMVSGDEPHGRAVQTWSRLRHPTQGAAQAHCPTGRSVQMPPDCVPHRSHHAHCSHLQVLSKCCRRLGGCVRRVRWCYRASRVWVDHPRTLTCAYRRIQSFENVSIVVKVHAATSHRRS